MRCATQTTRGIQENDNGCLLGPKGQLVWMALVESSLLRLLHTPKTNPSLPFKQPFLESAAAEVSAADKATARGFQWLEAARAER